MNHHHQDESLIKVPKKWFGTSASIFAVLASMGGMCYKACVAYERHIMVEKAKNDRLEAVERWKCVLGWNPPETRNVDRVCKVATKEPTE